MAKNGSNKGRARTKTSKQRELDEAQQMTRPENPKPSKKQKRVPSLPPSPSPSASPSPEESPIVDVSHKQFTLNMKCTLGGVTVHSDADVLKLGEFEFHKYFTKTVMRIEREAAKAKVGFEWIKGEAELSADGVAKNRWLHPQVEDEAGWEKVESMIKGWMTSSKKITNINVALVLSYKKTILGTDGEDVEDEPAVKGRQVRSHER
jgi:hypothetical protein